MKCKNISPTWLISNSTEIKTTVLLKARVIHAAQNNKQCLTHIAYISQTIFSLFLKRKANRGKLTKSEFCRTNKRKAIKIHHSEKKYVLDDP